MTEATQTFTLEIETELACDLVTSGDGRDDPKAADAEDVRIVSMFINGTVYTRNSLINRLGVFGALELMEIIMEAAPTGEWRTE